MISQEGKEFPFWRTCALLTFLALTLSSTLGDAVHEFSDMRHGWAVGDFAVYYTGGKLAREKQQQDLYNAVAPVWLPLAPDGGSMDKKVRSEGPSRLPPYIAPPFSALVMEPLTFLPFDAALLVWKVATMLMTVFATVLAFLAASGKPSLDFATLCILIAGALSFYPFAATIHNGQQGGLILLCFALGLYMFHRQCPVTSAFCFALGTVVKVSPAIAVPLFAMRKQWRWLIAYLCYTVVLTAISIWRLGWENHQVWLTQIYPTLSCRVESFFNRSIAGFLGALWAPQGLMNGGYHFIPIWLCRFQKVLSICLCLAFLAWVRRKSKGTQGLVHEVALLPLVALMVSPVSHVHHFISAIVPLTYLWATSRHAGSAATRFEVGILAFGTAIFGTPEFDYAAVVSNSAALGIVIAGLWPLASFGFIWVGVNFYQRRLMQSEGRVPG